MKLFAVIVMGFLGFVGLVLLGVYTAGALMPRTHRSQLTAVIPADRAAVWAAITDYESMPSWWPAVKSVRTERLPDGAEVTWNKDSHGQEVPFRTAEARPREKLVRVISSTSLPYGGTWTFELADAPGGATQLTLTEDGWIGPAILRALAKWFIGLDSMQRDFIAHLQAHLAAPARS
jgi:uncharacterized protein YndB with AHSA1/START domain